MTLATESGTQRDIGEGMRRCAKQFLGKVDAPIDEPGIGRFARSSSERSRKLTGTHADCGSPFTKIKFCAELRVCKLAAARESVVIEGSNGRALIGRELEVTAVDHAGEKRLREAAQVVFPVRGADLVRSGQGGGQCRDHRMRTHHRSKANRRDRPQEACLAKRAPNGIAGHGQLELARRLNKNHLRPLPRSRQAQHSRPENSVKELPPVPGHLRSAYGKGHQHGTNVFGGM
jgi:hypothetical protein